MADLHLPHLSKLALGLVAVFVGYTLLQNLLLSRKRNAIAREKGALPSPKYPQSERIIGYRLFKENIHALKTGTFLEASLQRFAEMGVNTFSLVALGRTMHTTIEPENLKTIQAVNFKHWGLGERRKVAFKPLLGDGIFTTDGAAWAHSR